MNRTALMLGLILVVGISLGMVDGQILMAQQASGNVLTVVAKIYPKAGKQDDVGALLVKMTEAVRKNEPDCLIYRPHKAAKEPAVFVFYEQYRSQAAFEFHRTAPHLVAYREQLKGLVDKPTEVEIYHSLTD